MDNTKVKGRLGSAPADDGQVAAALVGSIIGMIAGTLPAVIWALIFGRAAWTLYAVTPLVMHFFIRLLKGCRDIRAAIIMAALSLLGAYLTSVSVEAAVYVRLYGMQILSVPLVAASAIGNAAFFPKVASGYVFPLLFTALGATISRELLLHGVPE